MFSRQIRADVLSFLMLKTMMKKPRRSWVIQKLTLLSNVTPLVQLKLKLSLSLRNWRTILWLTVNLNILYPTVEAIPAIYGLPKIHSKCNSETDREQYIDEVTYDVAKYLAKVLGTFSWEIWTSYFEDFDNKINWLKLNHDETITSFDVTALFKSIPPNDAV